MTDEDDLVVSDDGRVRLLRLNRPDALNAFDTALYRATADALDAAADDPDIAVVVITGTGRAFSAGQDLVDMAALADGSGDAGEAGFPRLMEALVAFPKPLIAAINGLGLGIGMTIVGHCDLAVMAASARLRAPFTALGVAPEAASSYTFGGLVGWQHAAHLLLTSEWVDAETAERIGLVWKAVPDDELDAVARELAATIAQWPISSLVATKETVRAAHRDQIAAARAREDAAFQQLMGSPANLEALTAFSEKRTPDFSHLPGE